MSELIITAICLGLIALGIALCLALVKARRGPSAARVLGLVAFFVGMGFLPLWASLVLALVGSVLTTNSEYWAAAPWLVFIAAPFSVFTAAMTIITYFVYRATNGDHRRKFKYAAVCFSILTTLALSVAGSFWWRHQARDADLQAEKKAALAFVERSEALHRALPGAIQLSLHTWSETDGFPTRYTFYAVLPPAFKESMYAIVDVSRSAGAAEFHLACVVSPLAVRELEYSIDPCRAATPSSR